jgi:hypothetical protein
MRFAAVLLAAFGLAQIAWGQIELRLSLDREFFLAGEDLEVAVKVANFSGAPLKLGEQPDWLKFSLERSDSGVVSKRSEVEESGSFTLEHATVGTLRFNLAPHFAVGRPGSYRVTAQATLPHSGEVFTSDTKTIELVRGVQLNPDRVIGVTLPDGTTVKRKFILQQVNFMRKVQLYLRIMDGEETTNIKVTNLGKLVSFDPPKWVVDRQNRFHVLHRVDAASSSYHLFLPDGTLERRELYRFTASTPELRVNEAGEVAVVGGIRRPSSGDVPSPKTNRPPAALTSTNAPATNAVPTAESKPDRQP